MSLIPQILPVERVFIDMDFRAQDEVFEHVADVFERGNGLSRKLVVSALLQREKLGSTGLGQGVAIPHGRIRGLKQTLGAFVRVGEPIESSAPDGCPVNLIFVMLVPEQANESHLQLLSELAQMFSDRGFRERLCQASSAEVAWNIFNTWSPNAANECSPAV